MATEITMPKLSDTMTEGRLGAWKKGIGEAVQRGDVIAEVETDKAVMDLEAFTTGVLLEQRVKAGQLVPVGTVIGLIGAPDEAVATALPPASEPPVDRVGIGPERVIEEPAPPVTVAAPDHHEEQAAPVVRRKAREMGIDLALVQGSGPGGRVLLEDLERFSGVSLSAAPLNEEPEPATAATGEAGAPAGQVFTGAPQTVSELPLSRMRAAIARTVELAWRTIPHFFVTMEVFMDAALELRRELKANGIPASVNDFVLKASAVALQKFPRMNASFGGDRIIVNQEINIGVAVSLPDGLLVPVLRGCQGLSLREIAARSRPLFERARSSRLSEAELSGGTFTISNLGMYGVHEFAAVIMPPQAAILAVGGLQDAVLARHGQPMVGKVMKLTISADHRILDGAYAAGFLRELKGLLEHPVKLLL
ncbi:dihydrolipoamide acetyltransferase family protein [Geobacter argillaceus]|uniref:Dihydrolipoamide acetyltransferase component of pyruvate dehydrogenase complex n=1 Tax=Geobacter argillaceus TaxID=345631 RepID=A0A562WSR9_9BACT|nr:dihydrolipoamide acetyltransferase family protein [Geobacter argillaceus]TWJ33396.1 pyruvate dehydrogenase E2 component (dihydrolipoamide acetyltransferase) [Geobacter argillaceus]